MATNAVCILSKSLLFIKYNLLKTILIEAQDDQKSFELMHQNSGLDYFMYNEIIT